MEPSASKFSPMKYLWLLGISFLLATFISSQAGPQPWLAALPVLGLLVLMTVQPRLRRMVALTLIFTGGALFVLTLSNLDFLARRFQPPPLDVAALESGQSRSTPARGTWLTGPLKVLYQRGKACSLPEDDSNPNSGPSFFTLYPVVSRHHPAFVDPTDESAPLRVWVVGEPSWRSRKSAALPGLEVAEATPQLRGVLQKGGVRAYFVFRPNETGHEATFPGTTHAFYLGCLLVALGGALFLGTLWRDPTS